MDKDKVGGGELNVGGGRVGESSGDKYPHN